MCVQPVDSLAAGVKAAGPGTSADGFVAPAAGVSAPRRRIHMYGGSHVVLNGRSYEVTKEDRVDLFLEPNQVGP